MLHPIGGNPLLAHVVAAAQQLGRNLPEDIRCHIGVGYGSEQVSSLLSGDPPINYVEQLQQFGTGHAVKQTLPYLSTHSTTLILCGDAPLISTET